MDGHPGIVPGEEAIALYGIFIVAQVHEPGCELYFSFSISEQAFEGLDTVKFMLMAAEDISFHGAQPLYRNATEVFLRGDRASWFVAGVGSTTSCLDCPLIHDDSLRASLRSSQAVLPRRAHSQTIAVRHPACCS